MPDAAEFGDQGSNTLGNLARHQRGLKLPTLASLGLGNILPLEGVAPVDRPLASHGKLTELSRGKDSTLGHWELAGLVTSKALPVYPRGFPPDLLETWRQRCGLPGWLANRPASGTQIIEELGDEHVASGKPIVYTSADSVFQVAAHEDVIPIERLYAICEDARELLTGEHAVARVIARPFLGSAGNYQRTTNRRDFSLEPFGRTALDIVGEAGVEVVAIGKIRDLFAGVGIHRYQPSKGNADGFTKLVEELDRPAPGPRLILLNLVDFDMLWGHRCDPEGFKQGLEDFDNMLPRLLDILGPDDLLIMTADHGNDPTLGSTDHSREYVPLLVYQKGRTGGDLGTRGSFADVAATICAAFDAGRPAAGTSFLEELGT